MPPRGALAGLSISMLLSSLGTSIANVALPTLARELHVTFRAVQWVVLAYLLAITTLIVTVGRLGDVMGRRRLLVLGIAVFTAASFACGSASSWLALIAARAAQGLGAATMMSLTVAFVAETVPEERTGSAMGMLGTMSATGTALGPAIGGLLIAALGWRAIFFVQVPLGALALVLALRSLPVDRATPNTPRARVDVVGTLVLASTLAAYALAMTLGRGRFGAANLGLILIAVVGASVFVLVEARATDPLIRLGMFRRRPLRASLVMTLLVSTVMMATLVVGPFHLVRALGLEAALVGIVLSLGPLVAAMTGVPAGRLVDRFGPDRMTSLGLVGLVLGSLTLSVVPATLGLVGYVVPVVLNTASYALFQAANNTAVMTNVGAQERGVVSGLLSLARNLGLITGGSAMGAVFAFGAAAPDVTRASASAVERGMHLTFGVGAILALTGLVVSVRARELPSPSPSSARSS